MVARTRPDVALANHLIMGPAILARALAQTGIPYAVKVHGSALEYTVKPYPRFLQYAREGVDGAQGVLTGSHHTAESLWAALDDPGLPARTGLAPPGVDVALFSPRERSDALRRYGRSPIGSPATRTCSKRSPNRPRSRRSRETTRWPPPPSNACSTAALTTGWSRSWAS